MVKYDLLGFENQSEYLDYFYKTLLKTNRTYGYYVNWKKVKENVLKYLTEISILNSLTKIEEEDREEKLFEIISKYPEVISVIPLIIAVREKNLTVLDIGKTLVYRNFQFNRSSKNVAGIVDFCKKSGIIGLFGEINDLFAYLLGMEVGLDTNARKNRSGGIFEELVGLLLQDKLRNHKDYYLVREDSSIEIEGKRFDYVIYHNKKPKFVLECNFYATTGSKPKAIGGLYEVLQEKCKDRDLTFIWITDGPGWHKMKTVIDEFVETIDFLVNYNILDKKICSILNIEEI